MDQINLQVEYVDGTSCTVTAIASDLVAFESKFDMSVAKIADEIRLTHLFYLAWHVLHRTKQTELEFDGWCDVVASVGDATEKK